MALGDWPYYATTSSTASTSPFCVTYGNMVYNNIVSGPGYVQWDQQYLRHNDPAPVSSEEKIARKNKLPEGVEMKKLFEVYLVYGEDRKHPVVEKAQVIADSDEDAKVKSGLMAKINPDWDADYLTIEAVEIIEVKVKEKPKEVKQV